MYIILHKVKSKEIFKVKASPDSVHVMVGNSLSIHHIFLACLIKLSTHNTLRIEHPGDLLAGC